MTKNKGMRVKEVGATINLGDFSSLRITIGEESDFAGLDIKKAQDYLVNVADAVGGVLNLPTSNQKVNKDNVKKVADKTAGKKVRTYGDGAVFYDHETHAYASQDGTPYQSVTQFIGQFYPFNADGVIKQEYMDFAASFGNLVHTAIQNGVIGKAPKKKMVSKVVKDALAGIGKFASAEVEQILEDPEHGLAGRFDIITYVDDKKKKVHLWDVKTNSDLYAKVDCKLPDDIKKAASLHWGPETIYGEHCLQLNLYAYMLEKVYGKQVEGIHIIHVPDEFNEIVNVPKVDITAIFNAKV